jgi:DnaJ-class molecular chaperone
VTDTGEPMADPFEPAPPPEYTPCPKCGGSGRIRFYPSAGDACQIITDVGCTGCNGWGGWGKK